MCLQMDETSTLFLLSLVIPPPLPSRYGGNLPEVVHLAKEIFACLDPSLIFLSLAWLQMETGSQVDDLAEADRKYVSDDYKREVVEHSEWRSQGAERGVLGQNDSMLLLPSLSLSPPCPPPLFTHPLSSVSVQQLVDTILINPTVSITPSLRDTGLAASYTFHPLSNLVYTRDQQITTCK